MTPVVPTPFPEGLPVFALPDSYSLWGGAEQAVQTWYWLGDFGTVLQVIILLGAVAAAGFILYRGFIQFVNRDSES